MRALRFRVTSWVWGTAASALHCAGDLAAASGGASVLNLQSAERRRLTPLAGLALAAGERLVAGRADDVAKSVPLVYASRDGDGDVLLRLLAALRDRQPVSPTQFHNSVHNAPAGYWSIGLGSKAATTALAAGDETFEVALAEAGLQACARNGAVLLLVAQKAFPPELSKARPATTDFVLAAWCVPPESGDGWLCRVATAQPFGPLEAAAHAQLCDLPLGEAIALRGQDGLGSRRAVKRLAATLEISGPPC